MAESNSQEWIDARQAWWEKRDIHKKELVNATHFFDLEKSLLLVDHLDPDKSDFEDDRKFEMLEEACLDAQLKVLEVCSEFAKKKVSLDLAREEMEKAKKHFEDINFQDLQKSEEVA
tara:strand:+ start:254 stop:604 length:351 start_codon:yes stop_codon:yes gene_type:complete